MKSASYWPFIVGLCIVTAAVSEGGEMQHGAPAYAEDTVLDSTLKNVAGKKIYFGHQSVGMNILDGIQDIANDYSWSGFNIVKTDDAQAFKVPVLAHFMVGENEDPISKIEDFARSMDNGIGNKAEIAFFKFCYVDINRTTDVGKLLTVYKNTMKRLKESYPHTQFVHVTAPLMVTKLSAKSLLKKILGAEDNNIKRNAFNYALVDEYGGKEPIFDLAVAESTYSDGTRSTFTEGGKPYYSLVPEYTDDGGHLNQKGRKAVAASLLKFLSTVGSGNKLVSN